MYKNGKDMPDKSSHDEGRYSLSCRCSISGVTAMNIIVGNQAIVFRGDSAGYSDAGDVI